VLLAEQLSPADLVQLPRDNVIAMVTRTGSRTDHTSLVARSLGIPAVVAAAGDIKPSRDGQRVLVDAEQGRVFFSPGREQLALHKAYTKRLVDTRRRAGLVAEKQARTSDGHRILLKANIELLQEADFAASCGAEGVGLFRTEFLFISAERLPDEKRQVDAYTELAERFAPHAVTLRVYDLGGDKLFYAHRPEFEPNPALGWRAVRLLLDRPALFRTQLRAMYRAAAQSGNVQIMFPMVSSLEEWRRILAFTERVCSELVADGVSLPQRVPLGVMVEIPSLALEADTVASECDFFSVGTNDLVQYLLAVDRQNPLVSGRYEPLHPAVLRMLRDIVVAAHARKIPVSLCGDLASDLRALPLLVGLGFDELSTVPSAIPEIKTLLTDFSRTEAVELTRAVLCEKTPRAILALLDRTWKKWHRRARQREKDEHS
jgi:phosphotransferase system enzyme I (PtsI)